MRNPCRLLSLLLLVAASTGRAAPSTGDLQLYKDTYEDSRAAFRAVAARLGQRFAGVETGALHVPSATDDDLTIDYAYVPAQEQPRGLVIVSSGVHGAEGFAGSAVQRLIAGELVGGGAVDVRTTGFLFLHAINPYGFKHDRRVDEHNVDLNRNFGVDDHLYRIRNAAYARLSPLLNPTDAASASLPSELAFLTHLAGQALTHSRGDLTQAIARGQYERPEGIMFGGQAPEPQQALLEPLLLQVSAAYAKVLILDVHTGFGHRGVMHLMPNPPDSDAQAAAVRHVFASYPVEVTGKGKDFYANDGDFSTYVARRLTLAGKMAVPMCIEFGTVDSQTYTGSLKTLTRVVRENQLHWHGAATPADGAEIRQDFRELFYPSGADWRAALLAQTRDNVPKFLASFATL